MRLIVTFEKLSNPLPIHYNHIIQAFIYNNISNKLASFLHKKGYSYGKRSFKLFTFSRLFGKFKLVNGNIKFEDKVKLYIASPDKHFIQEFGESILKKNNLKLFNQKVKVSSIEVKTNPEIENEIFIKTLSPITVYSTLKKLDGKKKTYYYSPYEEEFYFLIEENIKKKYEIIHKRKPTNYGLVIKPLKNISEVIVKYKDFIIKGWTGEFELKGTVSFISLAYDTGLGSKNSQGFGMFEIIKNEH